MSNNSSTNDDKLLTDKRTDDTFEDGFTKSPATLPGILTMNKEQSDRANRKKNVEFYEEQPDGTMRPVNPDDD